MQIKHLRDAEYLETQEGLMRPLVFGERLMVFHLEIPPRFKGEGILYCLSGDLEATFGSEKVNIKPGTAMLIPPNMEVGVENKKDESVRAIIVGSPPMVKSVEELKELIKVLESKTRSQNVANDK